MASSASLMVTPFRLRAVTSSPKGKCRSIFLMGGWQRSFLRTSLSSMDEGAVLSFLHSGRHVSPAPYSSIELTCSASDNDAKLTNTEHQPVKNYETYQFSFCVSGAILSSTPSFSAHVISTRTHSTTKQASSLTEIIDVEDAGDRTARSPVLDLLLVARRGRDVRDGGVDLAKVGIRFLHAGGHGCVCEW